MGLRPPGVEDTWEDNSSWAQAQLLAYSQIRDYEDQENSNNVLSALTGSR